MALPSSARTLTADELDLVESARVLLDDHSRIRVILPTREGLRSALIEELMPLTTAWSREHGSETA